MARRRAGCYATSRPCCGGRWRTPRRRWPACRSSQEERVQLLGAWSGSGPATPGGAGLHRLIAERAARAPEAVAVEQEGERLTYRELDLRANRLAHRLRRLGVGPEVPVAVAMELCPDLLVALLGVWKAGGAYVPLDADAPPERAAYILGDTRAPVALVRGGTLLPPGPYVLDLAAAGALDAEDGEDPALPAPPEGLAYVLYTSGSSGRPKGCMVEHRSLVNYLSWVLRSELGRHPLPAVTRPTFDASLKQLFAPLLAGRAVWLLPPGAASRPVALVEALRSRPRAGLNCVPSLWRAILDAVESRQVESPAGALTDLFLGGEALDRPLVERSLALVPGLRIWNVYGPTEATANAAFGPVMPGAGISLADPGVQGEGAGAGWSRCRWRSPARSGSAAPGSPAATWGGRT